MIKQYVKKIGALSIGLFMLSIGYANENLKIKINDHALRSQQTGKTLFQQYRGDELGIKHIDILSPQEFTPPFWNGRGISTADINQDGYPDIAIGTEEGPKIYLNEEGKYFSNNIINHPELKQNTFIVALVDINNDGWLDLFFTTYATGNFFILNNKGKFDQKNLHKLDEHPLVLTKSLSFADIDQDNDLDAVAGNWHYGYAKHIPPENSRNKILFNNSSKGTTEFISKNLEYEILGETLSTLLSDFNQDGNIDLLVGNDFSPPDMYYYGDGAGKFNHINRDSGIIPETTDTTMSIDTGDLNNDLKLDIYIAQIAAGATGASTRVLVRDWENYCDAVSEGTNKEQCKAAVRQRNLFDFGAKHQHTNIERCNIIPTNYFRDNCKAHMILLSAIKTRKQDICNQIPERFTLTNFLCANFFLPSVPGTEEEYKKSNKIIRNENVLLLAGDDGKFTSIANESGTAITSWSWTGRIADYDNDELQDIYIVNGTWIQKHGTPPKYFYKNMGGMKFEEKADDYGLQNFMLQSAFSLTDLDLDGDLDIVSNSMNGPLWIYYNHEKENNTLTISLRDTKGNSHCIGCKVIINYGEAGKEQIREIKSGGGFQSFDEPLIHFGLGSETHINSLTVQWSTGETDIIKNNKEIKPGKHIIITRQ